MDWLPLTLAALLALACLPVFLRQLLPPVPPDDDPDAPACVLVLGAGRKLVHGKVRLSTRSLMRLEAAVALATEQRLPLLLSGGAAQKLTGASEAELMAEQVQQSAAELVVWQENASLNTYENARLSAVLLQRKGVHRVYLVTDRVHLCRALLCLKKQGISARAQAADILPQPDWLPHAGALSLWPELMHEWLALAWYALRRRV